MTQLTLRPQGGTTKDSTTGNIAGQKSGPSQAPDGLVRFSTIGLPDPQRVELWENHNAQALIGLGCRTLDNASLDATELNLQLPNLQFAHVAGNPHVVERTRHHIDANPADAVVLYFTLEGEAFFYHEDGCRILQPGQAVMYDADRPFMRGFSQGLKELALKVPRQVYAAVAGSSAPQMPQVFDFRSSDGPGSHGHALARLMDSALRSRGADAARTEATAVDLLTALVGGTGAAGPAAHFAAAGAFIERRLRDQNLSATRIAEGIGISERQLSRVFSAEGTSVAGFILKRRLDLAGSILTSRRGGRMSIGQIAQECGFSSQAYFARTFKERFGATPVQLRRQVAAG